MNSERSSKSTLLAVVIAWAVVVVPTLWGIWQTAHQSAALFVHAR